MCRIAIIAHRVRNRNRFISGVRRITGMSIADIASHLDEGLPLIERFLFMNDHDEVATQLHNFITFAEQEQADLRIFEFADADLARVFTDAYEISATTLRNILDSHEKLRSQRES
jgi:hypothetical protein